MLGHEALGALPLGGINAAGTLEGRLGCVCVSTVVPWAAKGAAVERGAVLATMTEPVATGYFAERARAVGAYASRYGVVSERHPRGCDCAKCI